jgi:RNA methyltransferase, TrmH family
MNELVFGLRAALAAVLSRPADILKLHYASEVTRELTPSLLQAASAVRSSARELEKLTGSNLHEGLAVEMKPRAFLKPQALAKAAGEDGLLIALDRVRNPYNVGAILRTAAFYGVSGVLLGAQAHGGAGGHALDPLAVRVAEGGAEHLALSLTTDLAGTLAKFREVGFAVIGADVRGEPFRAPHAASASSKQVLVLGHEREGISERVLAQCTRRIRLQGTGKVESLNVGVAAGILIAAFTHAER